MFKEKAFHWMGAVIIYMLAAGLVLSCSDSQDETFEMYGTGMVRLDFSSQNDFSVTKSRAITDEDFNKYKDVNNYKVVILQDGETVQEYASAKEVPASVELRNGSYTIKASYGVEHAKSRDEFYSGDAQVITVQGNDQTVNLLCEPTCAKVAVNFDGEMATYFENYQVDYSTHALGQQVATWAKADVDPWYLLVEPEGEEIKATITLTPKAEFQIPVGTIEKTYAIKPNQGWTLNIAPSYNATNGNLGITVTIDESTTDIPVDIEVPSEWITEE